MKLRLVLACCLAISLCLVVGASAQLTLPFAGSTTSASTAFSITNNGSGNGIYGLTLTGNYGVFGESRKTGGTGVYGLSNAGRGVVGVTLTGEAGVKGGSTKLNGIGIYGVADNGSAASGVYGVSQNGRGVVGVSISGEAGVKGGNTKSHGIGVWGVADSGINAMGVRGNSTSGYGVFGNGARYGVYGNSASGHGVRGYSTSGTGVSGYSASGFAGYFSGPVHITGQVTKAYTSGTTDPAIPIAYGTISSTGTLLSGTANVSSTYNATADRYEVTIAGENYFYTEYTTVVTITGSDPAIATSSSVSGLLLIYISDLSGNPVQRNIQFVTYKATER